MIARRQTASQAMGPDAERDSIHVAAADWLGRLSNSDVSLEDTLAWQNWMKADAKHAEAFYRFEQISLALKGMKPPPPPSRWEWSRDEYDASLALSEWKTRSSRPRFAVAAAVATLAIAAAATWIILGSDLNPWAQPDAVQATAVGENRTLNLADGSTVTLGGATRLEWSFTNEERSLELIHGEAWFKVAKDTARPFKVRAGGATVVAVGTAFNVNRRSDRTVVSVTDGRVVVEPAPSLIPFKPKPQPVHVDAGEQTIAGSAGIENASKVQDLAATTSWRTGRLTFRLQPLRYALEDVNRYASKPISVADEDVGSLLVSGTVIGDNVDGWVESLERAFGLIAVEEADRIVLTRRK